MRTHDPTLGFTHTTTSVLGTFGVAAGIIAPAS